MKPMRPGFYDTRGFTLLETLITLSILVLLLGIVFSAMRLGIRSWEKGESAANDLAERRAIASRLTRDIASMYPYIQKEEGVKTGLFEGKRTSMGFVTAARSATAIPWGGLKWVYYAAGKDGLTITEKTVPSANIKAQSGGALIGVAQGVDKAGFEYIGDGGWEDTWDFDGKGGLPKAIRVKIAFKDKRKPLFITVSTNIRGRKDASQTAVSNRDE